MRGEARGSGLDPALKLVANTLYGCLCSTFLPTQNVVAAQVVTATARALAFAMAMSLNSYNAITDGVIYRRDQIPRDNFARCLVADRNYPIERPEKGGRFLPAAGVPTADEAFGAWYAKHVKRFFGVRGKGYDFLFGLHRLRHKALPASDRTDFDALVVDGAANYVKLTHGPDGWTVADMKARSFRDRDKKRLGEWLVSVTSTDSYSGPPEAIESFELLSWGKAVASARKSIRESEVVFLPLGWERPRLQIFKLIKASQFVFESSRQKRRIEKEWKKLVDGTGCGPEILALKRTYKGSVAAVARGINELIRSGKDRLRDLNTHRLLADGEGIGPAHAVAIAARRADLEERFLKQLGRVDKGELV